MRLNSNSDDELKDQSDDGNVQVLLHFADFKQTRKIACRLCVVPLLAERMFLFMNCILIVFVHFDCLYAVIAIHQECGLLTTKK